MSEENRVHCSECGKEVSSPVPDDFVIRAFVQCPECAREEYKMMEKLKKRVKGLIGEEEVTE